MPTEELNLVASAEDDFSQVLTELEMQLWRIGSLEEAVFDIEVGVDGVDETLAELEAVAMAMETIDSGVDVDINTDSDVSGTVGSAASTASSTASSGASSGTAMTSGGFDDPGLNLNKRLRSLYGIDVPSVSEAMDMPDPFGFKEDDSAQSLAEQFLDLQFVMGDFFKILAALIPMMGTFIGALPAAIAGLGALATAALAAAGGLAAIGGLGLLGMAMTGDGLSVKRLQQRITRLANTFLDAFRPVAESLVPMMERAFRDLNYLVRDLGRNAGVLRSLTDDFTALTHFLSRNAVPVLADVVAFGEATIPVFTALSRQFPDVNLFVVLANVMARALPPTVALITDIGRLLPVIFNLSMGFLNASRAVMMLFGGFFRLLNIIPGGIKIFGTLVGLMFTLLTVSALWTVVNNSVNNGLLSLLGTVKYNILAFNQMTWAEIRATIASWGLAEALWAVLSVATLGIATFALLSTQFNSLGTNIADATKQLRKFKGVQSGVSGFSGDDFTGARSSGSNISYNKFTIDANSTKQRIHAVESVKYKQKTRTDSRFASGL